MSIEQRKFADPGGVVDGADARVEWVGKRNRFGNGTNWWDTWVTANPQAWPKLYDFRLNPSLIHRRIYWSCIIDIDELGVFIWHFTLTMRFLFQGNEVLKLVWDEGNAQWNAQTIGGAMFPYTYSRVYLGLSPSFASPVTRALEHAPIVPGENAMVLEDAIRHSDNHQYGFRCVMSPYCMAIKTDQVIVTGDYTGDIGAYNQAITFLGVYSGNYR